MQPSIWARIIAGFSSPGRRAGSYGFLTTFQARFASEMALMKSACCA